MRNKKPVQILEVDVALCFTKFGDDAMHAFVHCEYVANTSKYKNMSDQEISEKLCGMWWAPVTPRHVAKALEGKDQVIRAKKYRIQVEKITVVEESPIVNEVANLMNAWSGAPQLQPVHNPEWRIVREHDKRGASLDQENALEDFMPGPLVAPTVPMPVVPAEE